ncbi:MAG: MFS transporter [Clostridia bacterium]|nr:MFS transporter [Clostridia bacterium]
MKRSLGYFFTVMFIFNMAANFVHPVTPAIIVDLGLNDYMFGLALAAMMACNFLFSPFWGKMVGVLSSKKVMMISALGYALGQVFFGLARTEMQFLWARLFAGIFVGGAHVAFLTYVVNCAPKEKRGQNLAIHATVNAVSASFGYFAGGMIGEINVYYTVWLQAAVLALCALLFYGGCQNDHSKEAPAQPLSLKDCNPFAALWQCRRLMTRLLALLFLAYGLGNLGYIAFEQCFNYYLRDQFLLTSGYNGAIKAALGLISLIANSTLCAWILKQKRISPYIAGVMGVCTTAMVGVILFEQPLPFIAVNVLFFAFYFISVPLMQNRAAVLGEGPNSNLVMGAFNAVKSFGSIFGSALAGFLYEWHPKMPFVFGFAAFLLAAVMAALMARAEKSSKA